MKSKKKWGGKRPGAGRKSAYKGKREFVGANVPSEYVEEMDKRPETRTEILIKALKAFLY